MAHHPPICKICKRPADDQDIRALSAHTDAMGETRVMLECLWCGHRWSRPARDCERVRGYKEAIRNATTSNGHIGTVHKN